MDLRIAICDDEAGVCTELENILEKLEQELSISCEMDVFFSGESLCKALTKTEYDLLFLDIEFPKADGIKTGNEI